MANKLITLKAYYPNADVFAISVSRPKTLMQSEDSIRENAEQVCGPAGKPSPLGGLLHALLHLAAGCRLLVTGAPHQVARSRSARTRVCVSDVDATSWWPCSANPQNHA